MMQDPIAVTSRRLMDNVPLVVAFLLLIDSLHFVFARLFLDYLPPSVSGLFMLAIATVETAVFLGVQGRIKFSVLRQHFWFFFVVGLLVAAATIVSFTAVVYIDPGTAAMLQQTAVVFTLLLGLFWLRERLTKFEYMGAAVALLGVFIISFQPGDIWRIGSLLSLASAFFYSLHVAVVKRYGDDIEFANFFLFRVGSTAVFLLLMSLVRQELVWPPGPVWPLLLLAGTVDVVVSRVLYYLVLRRVQMSFHAIILTLSPVITLLWSVLLFKQTPTLQGFLGGAAVIAGIIIVTIGRQQRVK
jgi:drug/metabolite transporter (DMT)-like permease